MAQAQPLAAGPRVFWSAGYDLSWGFDLSFLSSRFPWMLSAGKPARSTRARRLVKLRHQAPKNQRRSSVQHLHNCFSRP